MDDFETAKRFFFEGLRLLEANNYQAAEAQFARSLELIPDGISALNNLSAVKILLKKFAEAEAFALKAIALDDKSPEAWANLGIALAATQRPEEALQAYDRSLNCSASYAVAWLNKTTTLLELKRHEDALWACDQGLKLNPSDHKILYAKSLILKELDRLDEARKTYLKSLNLRVASSPVFMVERRAAQKADVLIISQNPNINASPETFETFETLHLDCPNYPGQLARLFPEDFHFSFVFEGQVRPATRKQIPQPDFVVNNHANGELVLTTDNLSGFIETIDSLGVPVVNHPTKVIQSTRDVEAKLLEGIPGVLVPKTMRFTSGGKPSEELVREIEDQFAYPLITRTLSFQRGIGMNKVDSRKALMELLSSGYSEKFFVTEFVDSKGENEFFRKIRAAIVKDEIVIARVDYDTGWKVHGGRSGRRVSFYLENRYLLDKEMRICSDPEAELGRPAIQALRAIRDRIPLDVFGMDFEVAADGRVVFYEANATMNLFSVAKKEVPYPTEAEDRLMLAFQRYLTSLAARRER